MAPPGQAAERARQFLRSLENRQQPAFDRMLASYRDIHAALEKDIADVLLRGALAGQDQVTLQQILERRQALLRVVEKRMTEYERAVRGATRGLVKSSAKAGLEHGAGQMEAWGVAQGVSVNEHALGALLAQGNTSTYLQAIPQLAKARAEQLLTQAVVLGWNPRRIAKELAGVADIAQHRALTIARTEMLRAYREGNRAQWEAMGPSLVSGWVWACAPSVRTCPVCFAMSGTYHPITESMETHPNCRCTMVAVPGSYAQSLSAGGLKPLVPDGEDSFRSLPADQQRRVLGPARYEQFKNGANLRSMVEDHYDPTYGNVRRLKRLRGPDSPPRIHTPPTPRPKPPPLPEPTVAAPREALTFDKPYQPVDRLDASFEQVASVHDRATAAMRAAHVAPPPHRSVPEYTWEGAGHRVSTILNGKVGGYFVFEGVNTPTIRMNASLLGKRTHIFREAGMKSRADGIEHEFSSYVTHEYGHHIDETFKRYRRFQDDRTGSDEYKSLFDAISKSKQVSLIRSGRVRAAAGEDARIPDDYRDYLLSDPEKFARAFQQWVAVESGDPELLGWVRRDPSLWNMADFEPIRREMTSFLRSIGWLTT